MQRLGQKPKASAARPRDRASAGRQSCFNQPEYQTKATGRLRLRIGLQLPSANDLRCFAEFADFAAGLSPDRHPKGGDKGALALGSGSARLGATRAGERS